MITFQDSNEFLLNEVDNRNHTVSTLLIPEELMPGFLFLLKNHESNVTLYLRNLLHMYRTLTHSGLIPIPIKVKTEYQEKDQKLHRVGFRPINLSTHLLRSRCGKSSAFAWIELGELALAFGKSRCWLFVYLLKLDILGLWYLLVQVGLNSAVPTLPNLELQIFRTLQRIRQNFARGYHVKI